jgi:hypothetical protein
MNCGQEPLVRRNWIWPPYRIRGVCHTRLRQQQVLPVLEHGVRPARVCVWVRAQTVTRGRAAAAAAAAAAARAPPLTHVGRTTSRGHVQKSE